MVTVPRRREGLTPALAAPLVGLLVVWFPCRAQAETPAPHSGIDASNRPHTLAQLGVGLLSLPAADVCLQGQTQRVCTKGDTTPEIDFWQLYRHSPAFGIGAGASLAINPTTDTPQTQPGLARSHTRGYFLVEAQARYYWLRVAWWEAWVGATLGGVIVSDRYFVEGGEQSNVALVGPGASTIRTEGATVGALLSTQWTVAPNWAVGASLRYAHWFLPQKPATSPFMDPATLTGQQAVLNLGLHVSYRIAL